MKPVFGVANSNTCDIAIALKRLRPRTPLFILGKDNPKDLKKAKIVVAPSVGQVRVLKKELSKMDATIFVIDTSVNLSQIKRIHLLDCKLDKDLGTRFFSLSDDMLEDCLESRENYHYKKLKFKKLDVAELMLKNTPVSVLSKIMTMLYSIPDKKKRELYRDVIFNWLVNADLSEDFLVVSLRLKGRGKNILHFLNSKQVSIVRSMFVPGANPKKIMKVNRISSFDYNYLRKFKEKTSKGKKK